MICHLKPAQSMLDSCLKVYQIKLTLINVILRRGSSSSAISAGNCKMNLPNAIKPNAYDEALISMLSGIDGSSDWNNFRLACKVVKP